MNKKLFLSLFSIWFCLMQPVQAQAISWEETWKTVKDNKVTALAAAALVVVGYYAYKFYRNMTPTKKKVRFAEPLENIITFEPISEESEERPISPISQESEQLVEKPEILPPVSKEIPQKETASVTEKELKEKSDQSPFPPLQKIDAEQIAQELEPIKQKIDIAQPSIPQEEQPDRPSEPKKKVLRFAPKTQLEQIKEIEPLSEEAKQASKLVSALKSYIDFSVADIKNRLARANKNVLHLTRIEKGPEWEFVVTGSRLSSEYEPKIDAFCAQLNAIAAKLDDFTKADIKISLEQYAQKLDGLKNSIGYIASQFEDPTKTLYDQFDLSIKNGFERKGLDPENAYEIMGFDKKNRFEITADELDDQYKVLAKQYDITTDPIGQQIREAYSVLGNNIGKLLYDHYLTAREKGKPELMNILAIPQEDIQKFDLDPIAMMTELSYYRNCLTILSTNPKYQRK